MDKILDGKLDGRLCNKMFSLFELCEKAKHKSLNILEPKFGWKKPILFSDIFDIEYFNENMQEVKMIPREKESNYTLQSATNNFHHAKLRWDKQRDSNSIPSDAMFFQVLKSLKLNKTNEQKANSVEGVEDLYGVHLRIEKDWQGYLKHGPPQLKGQKAENNFLIETDTFIKMYKEFTEHKNILLSTGEDHDQISKKFSECGINTCFYFDTSVEYEVSAAINFFLCVNCKKFIGISRSTFSDLISTRRFIANINDSYIYNYGNKIHERIDIGLHLDPALAIKNTINVY